MNALTLEDQFERALGAWDHHIERCSVCLVEGTTLCYEGEYLSAEVVDVREAIGADEYRVKVRSPIPIPIPDRRPIMPGAVA
ncbi:MAG: hypothetical protein ACREDK_02805 [Thermoplasmata archaeon]